MDLKDFHKNALKRVAKEAQEDTNQMLDRGLSAGNYDAAYQGGSWEENLENNEHADNPAFEAAYIIGFVSSSTDNWMYDDDYMDAWNNYGMQIQSIGLVADDPYEEQNYSEEGW